MRLTIKPLTADRWPALEDLFGPLGACSGCWCMYWRIGAGYKRKPREDNRRAFRAVVRRGPPPGLLAFDGDVAVGWCQVTPRAALPLIDRTWRLARIGERFYRECTPGYYNSEGAAGNKNGFFSEMYGAGPLRFFEVLEEWRANGRMEGLELR